MAKNLNDSVQGAEQFNEKEPRGAAFKSLFGVLQTTTFNQLSNEGFSKGFTTYPEEIIVEADTIKISPTNDDIIPSRTRTWITGSAGSTTEEKMIRGHFSTSLSTDTTSNPYVEKIIMPLTKVFGTNDQFYFAFGMESQSSAGPPNYFDTTTAAATEGYDTFAALTNHLFTNQQYILKNFINPFKFGAGYSALYFTSLNQNDPTHIQYESPGEVLSLDTALAGETAGGLFDYKEGGLFIATQPTDPEDPNLSSKPHPIWIEAYRYYGPTGISSVDHVITASKIQVEDNLNVDGAISIQGINLASVNSFTTSGSSTFGDDVNLDIHEFTGSVSITGSLNATASHAMTASFATNAGQSGITTTIFSSSLHDKVNGHYDITTLAPTNGDDVIEYIPLSQGLLISSSLETGSFKLLLGSQSSTLLTKPNRGVDSATVSSWPGTGINGAPHNGFDIFSYATSSNGEDHPDLSSYGPFATTNTDGTVGIFSTHSFSFLTPKKINKIGLWYSMGGSNPPHNPVEGINFVEGIQLSGSVDGNTWTPLFVKTNMNNERKSSNGVGQPSNAIITSSIITSTDARWPNKLGTLTDGVSIGIVHFTSSYFDSAKYQYYVLHVSGGSEDGNSATLKHYHYIHHVDLWEDKDLNNLNRKQINIGFDTTIPVGEIFSPFTTAVSSAFSEVGFVGQVNLGELIIINGTASANLNFSSSDNGQFDLLGVGDLHVTNSFVHNNLTLEGSFITDGIDNNNTLEQEKSIFMGMDKFSIPSSSIILKELNPIYFTAKTQDNNLGVDQFSAKIFGHHTEENVSDLYLDAYRIFNVADKEIRFVTLHPQGITIISSSQTLITGSTQVRGNLSVTGSFLINGQDITNAQGSGFPHNQEIEGGITASITGGLFISGNATTSTPFINLGSIPGDTLDSDLPGILTGTTLYVKEGSLFFGDDEITSVSQQLYNDLNTLHLTSSKALFISGNITSSGNISAASNISASGNLFANLPDDISPISFVTYDTSSGQLKQISSSNFQLENSGALSVSPIDEPYSCTFDMITVQRDTGVRCEHNPGSTTTNDVAGNSSSLVDGIENQPYDYFKIYPKGSGTIQDSANVIFNFKEPVIVSKFRQRFFNGSSPTTTFLPKNVKIYGKNTPFGEGSDDGTLLAQGAAPHPFTDNLDPLIDSLILQDPFGDGTIQFIGPQTGDGELLYRQANQRRTSSIAPTSLTSSFQYYRIRYSGSFSDKDGELGVIFQEITPVTRSFTQGTTTSFNNGVIDGEQIIVNNLEGTASYAIFAETTNNATNGFPFSGSATISGSLSVSGNVDFQNLSLSGNLNMSNYSIENVNNIDITTASIGYLESNQINTTTLNTTTLNVGTLPSSSTPPSGGINTTGPITVTSIIAGSVTESLDVHSILQESFSPFINNIIQVQGKMFGQLDDEQYAFTSSSVSNITSSVNTSIVVNQNTIGSYNNIPLTSSFYVKLRLPKPVLMDSFKISFLSEGGTIVGYNYLETSMSLDGNRLFTNAKDEAELPNLNNGDYVINRIDDGNIIVGLYGFNPITDNINITPASFWGGSNHWFPSSKIGILVDDPNFNFLYKGTNDSPYTTDQNFAPFAINSGLPENHRGVVFRRAAIFEGTVPSFSSDNTLDLSDPEAGLHIGYDFGEGNETIIHKYKIYQYKNDFVSDMVFEACNDTSSGNWTLIDANLNITTYENAIDGLYTTIQPFNTGQYLNAIQTRDNSNFQNTTPFRFYRFRFLGGATSFFKFEFFNATAVTEGAPTDFNPEYISIYSPPEDGFSGDPVSLPFNIWPGTLKNTTTVSSTDTEKTISLEEFNNINGNPLSKHYTIEFSGSHNPNNFSGVAVIQPVTRSFTTQSLTFGPEIHYPELPEGHPDNIDCTNASAVYYNVSTGTFYHTSSCGGSGNVSTITKTGIFEFSFANDPERLDGVHYIPVSSNGYIHSGSLDLKTNTDFTGNRTLRLTSMSIQGDLNQSADGESLSNLRVGNQDIIQLLNGSLPNHTDFHVILPENLQPTEARNITFVEPLPTESISMVDGTVGISASFGAGVNGLSHPVSLSLHFEYDVEVEESSNVFNTIKVDTIQEKTTSNGIEISSSIKLKSSTLTNNDNARRPLLVVDEDTGEIFKSKNTFDGTVQTELDGDIQIKGDMSLTGSFDAHRAIIGISGSEKRSFNREKLINYFDVVNKKYSLYVRNGDTIVGGDIIPDTPHTHSLGSEKFPFKHIHVDRGTIFFYSGSSETSGSAKDEIGTISVNTSSKEIEFKSGSEFTSIRTKGIEIGTRFSSSVQISDDGQGFIAVSSNNAGQNSTVLRAESDVFEGDLVMGSITQKGSGSFAILLDADGNNEGAGRPDAKFVVESNAPLPGIGSRLLSVSESGETRVYDHLQVDTNITASGNISASGTVTAETIHSKFIQASKDPFTSVGQDDSIRFTTNGGINTFIGLKADLGSTIFRPENSALQAFGRNYVVGSITQKGSGSFEILLDADSSQSDLAQFSIRSNSAIPGIGGLLLTVSESGETRMYDSLNVDNHITASGNISSSGQVYADTLQLNNLPTSPSGLPVGTVWVSGSKSDNSTDNVNCGTLMIVL